MNIILLTFFSHANFNALLQPAILALIPVININRAILECSACVGQISSNAALEETFATFACEDTIMLP